MASPPDRRRGPEVAAVPVQRLIGGTDVVDVDAREVRADAGAHLARVNRQPVEGAGGLHEQHGVVPSPGVHLVFAPVIDAGADLRSVQELLGHAHLVTT